MDLTELFELRGKQSAVEEFGADDLSEGRGVRIRCSFGVEKLCDDIVACMTKSQSASR